MKEIFIGSSTEALEQAKQIALSLSEDGFRPVLWTEYFKPGDITFLGIERIAERVVGAIFLASPDDDSVIREKKVKTSRANVLFEYGYLTAMLTRSRVALCVYDNVSLPSDFSGLTHVPMGSFDKAGKVDDNTKGLIKKWAQALSSIQIRFPCTRQLHGYSGLWQIELDWQKWRKIPLIEPNYSSARGNMVLLIPTDGIGGSGYIHGKHQIQTDTCYAEFLVTDFITYVEVLPNGNIHIRSTTQSRQRIKLEGQPPQRDGFEPDLR